MLEPTWGQHGPNLIQLGANLGPCWVQIGSSRPSCSNHEGILRPLWAYTTQDAKNDPKIVESCSKKCQKLMLSKLPKHKETLENVGPEGNCEKTTTKLKHSKRLRAWAVEFGTWEGAFWSHVGVFWGPSWGFRRSKLEVWEPFWGLCWVLQGANGGLGGPEATGKGFGRAWVGSGAAGGPDLGPTWAQLEPSWSQLGDSRNPT